MSYPDLEKGNLVRYDMKFPRPRELWNIEPEGMAIVIKVVGRHYVKLKVFGRDLPICLPIRHAGITICSPPKENAP